MVFLKDYLYIKRNLPIEPILRGPKKVKDILNFDDFEEEVKSDGFHLFYLSRPTCGVCKALLPKVEEMATHFPKIDLAYVNLDKVPQAAGQYSIFTIPGILLFVDGREMIREARHISLDGLEVKIDRLYNLAYSD